MTWCSDKNEAVTEALCALLDVLGVETRGSAQRNAALAVLTRLYAAGSKAGPQREVRNLERERIYGRAYVRAGNKPPTSRQVAAAAREVARMKREVLRPFGAAPVDGAAGE